MRTWTATSNTLRLLSNKPIPQPDRQEPSPPITTGMTSSAHRPPTPLSPPPPPVLTPFALKYGITPTRETFNAMLNPAYPRFQKSLYTPILPLDPNANGNERDRVQKTLNLQMFRLKGFTTLALIENDFVSERRMRMASLTNPIHPLFARRRWEAVLPGQLQYPLIDGNGIARGVWNLGHNDLAWQVTLPAIRLASMILSQLHTHPWLDTILLGKEEPLDPSRFPAPTLLDPNLTTAHDHRVVRIRPPGPSNANECSAAFLDLQNWPALRDIQFGMVCVDKGPLGKAHTNAASVNGFATWLTSSYGNRAVVYIAYERVALLLRNDLSESDRLCLHLLTANTLVHEMMHCIGMAKRHRDQVRAGGEDTYPEISEPYLEDEVIAELGASMDDAVWGGALHGILDSMNPGVVPLGYGVLKGPQPILSSFPSLLTPPLPKKHLFRPIQVSYYEAVQQSDYWDFHVRNFASFRPGSITRDSAPMNLISTMDRDPPTQWEVVHSMPEYLSAVAPPNRATAIIQRILLMTNEERKAYANATKVNGLMEQYMALMGLRTRQAEGVWDQVEMLARGDILIGGFSVEQGLGSLLTAIEELLGTETNILLLLGRFDTSSAAWTAGRADAQSFNRGLRNLLKDIALVSSNAELTQKATTLSAIIESTRIILTVSPSLPAGISLQNDILLSLQDEADYVQRIEEAHRLLEAGDHANANKMCEQVSRSMSSTLLTKCAARILMCHSDRKEYAVRLGVVSRTIETLQKTPPPVGRDEEQKRVLTLALQLQARLLSGYQARPSSNGVFLV